MANFSRSQEVYGVTNASTFLSTPPVVSQRAPQTTDGCDLGTVWVYQPAQAYYILTDNTGGVNTWTAQTSGAGVFPTVDVNGGSGTVLTVDTGNTSLGGALSVAGAATFAGTTTVNGNLVANGDFTLSSNSAVSLTSDANAAPSVLLATNGGTSETIEIHNIQGTGQNAIYLLADAGDINLKATASTDATAINLDAVAGGFTIAGVVSSSIGVTGASQNLSLLSTGGKVQITGTQSASGAVTLSASGSSGTVAITGVGGVTVAGTNNTVAVTSGTGAMNISADAAATTVSIGTGAAAKSVTVGSTNSTSSTLVQSGSGTLGLVSSSGNVSVGTTNGTLTLTSGTGNLGVSTDAAATTVSIATGAAAKALTLGSTNSTSSSVLQSGASGSISVNSNGGTLGILSGTGTISFSADSAATTVNIGTGAAAKTVTVGSTNTTSATVIQAGSGSVKISGGRIQTLTAAVISTASPYTALSSDNLIQVDPTGGAISILLPNAPSTGRIYTIKDSTGEAATHNITVTTVGGSVDIDGATSATISANYGKLTVIFNGTAYLTI